MKRLSEPRDFLSSAYFNRSQQCARPCPRTGCTRHLFLPLVNSQPREEKEGGGREEVGGERRGRGEEEREREREREVSGNCNAAWSLYGVISTGGSGRT